jgi:hypothetical protein
MQPLLFFAKDGRRLDVAEEVIKGLERQQRGDLLGLTFSLTSLIFKEEAEREWLKERFGVLKDLLKESWGYQEMERWAREDARAKVQASLAEEKAKARLETLR